jgi:hypothetical protein
LLPCVVSEWHGLPTGIFGCTCTLTHQNPYPQRAGTGFHGFTHGFAPRQSHNIQHAESPAATRTVCVDDTLVPWYVTNHVRPPARVSSTRHGHKVCFFFYLTLTQTHWLSVTTGPLPSTYACTWAQSICPTQRARPRLTRYHTTRLRLLNVTRALGMFHLSRFYSQAPSFPTTSDARPTHPAPTTHPTQTTRPRPPNTNHTPRAQLTQRPPST